MISGVNPFLWIKSTNSTMNALLVRSVNKRAVITDRNQFALSIFSKNNDRAHLTWTPDPSGHARKGLGNISA